jgi:hypothetical protein
MKPLLGSLVVASISALFPVLATAQDYPPPPAPVADAGRVQRSPAPGARRASVWEERYDEVGPSADPRPAETGAPSGEWVRTAQYGWAWMPFADAYTRVPPDGYGEPFMYVYRPAYGWSWLAAPWVWGLGVWPTFGVYGAAPFGWYGHGWWRTPERWHWRGDSFRGEIGPGRGWGTFRGGHAPSGAGMARAFGGGGHRGWGR